MFSVEYFTGIKLAFDQQMNLLDEQIDKLGQAAGEEKENGLQPGLQKRLLSEKKKEIMDTFARCTEEEAQALCFLYSAMPVSDLLDYPAALFLSYAKHGVFLWNRGPFAGRVPEELFANYVLHYRVNNEDITDTRGFFYDKLKAGKVVFEEADSSASMYDTAIEANYWCAAEATYRSTDGRTQNPRTMFGTAIGRCGEESTLAVTVLRSIGIPARQIYAPLWSHCDDNHAWVELWCDGEWHFLGACEPEERLDRGWYTGPASRAMLLHSRWFGSDEPAERQVGPKGMAKVLNHLDRYARVRVLKVKAVDEKGRPLPHAKVKFQVPNHGEFGSIAVVYTGESGEECGVARFTTGQGSLYVSSSYCEGEKKYYGEALAGEDEECLVVLKEKPECFEGFKDLDFTAPRLGGNEEALTAREQRVGAERLAQAAEYRQKKAEGFYQKREADRVLDRFGKEERQSLEKLLYTAHSNMGEIVRFMEWDAAGLKPKDWQATEGESWKIKLLEAMREKDCWDTKVEVLIDCCVSAMPYAGSVPDDIFFRYLANPRVSNEMLKPCRKFLYHCLTDEEREALRSCPEKLPERVDQWVERMPEREYEDLLTSPVGCIRGGIGSSHSREVLCVNLYRSLGIPARLSGFDHRVEYYSEGRFVPAQKCPGATCTLTLRGSDALKLDDWEHYSLERFEGDGFCRLGLWEKVWKLETEELTLTVVPGIYRVVTLNRLPDGGQLARTAVVSLEEGQEKEITLSLREIPVEAMLVRNKLEDVSFRSLEGRETKLSELTSGGKTLILWLEVTREPTEHILNELFEQSENFAGLTAPLYVVLKSAEDMENATFRRTFGALPGLRPILGDFGSDYPVLAGKAGQESGRLPLALVVNQDLECIYSDSGYNVGMADMLFKVLA